MSFVVGLGARREVPASDLVSAVMAALAGAGVRPAQVRTLATLDRRAAEEGVRSLAREQGWELRSFSAAELSSERVPRPSEVVGHAVGTSSVAEAAALRAAGGGAHLLLPKRTFPAVTVAIAGRTP